MIPAFAPVIAAVAAVLITAMICGAALSAWRGWLALKHAQGTPRGHLPAEDNEEEAAQQSPAALIELASVKERLRRLEAIASGVEL